MKILSVEKGLIDKLIEECIVNIDENEMIYNGTVNEYGNICNYCTIHIILFVISFLIILAFIYLFILFTFIYFHCYLERDTNITKINPSSETTSY